MKRVVLVRHAKSSWDDPEQEDIVRPLNERGRLAAPVIGAWLAERKIEPDLVATSPAARCVQTWDKIKHHLGRAPKPKIEKALYMADPSTMMKVLTNMPDDADTVLVIGHQPGLSSFARKLANGTVPSSCSRSFTKFPTASAAVIEFDTDVWSNAKFGEGEFRNFATPKDLV